MWMSQRGGGRERERERDREVDSARNIGREKESDEKEGGMEEAG